MIQLTNNKDQLQNYLTDNQWLKVGEKIEQIEVPGEGNMNFTLRVKTASRSIIIKQSRDFVEKYPQVAAPEQRALREAEFYNLIQTDAKLKAMTPNLIAVDKENNVLAMEDLGISNDFFNLYEQGNTISETDLNTVIDFASHLHSNFTTETTSQIITNRDMRKLNHEHIFIYPFLEDNGLNLDDVLSGLADVALPYKQDDKLKNKLNKLGEKYLADGDTLLHGDYFPGSWLKTDNGIKIIDPEFCFFGFPEFEIAVTIAHLKMAEQPQHLIEKAIARYTSQAKLNIELLNEFVGVEMMRRIIGLAQLPLTSNLKQRKSLLKEAHQLILQF